MLKESEQKKAAQAFAAKWQGRGYEKGETQKFWFELLQTVYGVENPADYLEFEVPVQLDHTSFIDVYIPATRVMIEQKSLDKDLSRPIKQSDGSMLNPLQQMKRYAAALGFFKYPRWGITCNFRQIYIYDMGQPNGEPSVIELKDLPTEYHRLNFLVDTGSDRIRQELQVSLSAGTLVGKLYDSLLAQYGDKPTEEMLQSLNMLIVRIVFCLYAEDAGIFGHRNMFHDYLADFRPQHFRRALLDLFEVLDTPENCRDPYMEKLLSQFPYVNGGLFAKDNIIIPTFSQECIDLIMNEACPFDWSGISPTIFGAVFESTLSAKVRRSGGMHYTSLENIHKVIDPLFLNDLQAELADIQEIPQPKQQRQKLLAFQDKLAGLTFLDPACGSGNFLTETYISLRRLENQVIQALNKGQVVMGNLGDMASPVKVSIHQFYGMEINDFACVVAKTAMWIAELQMLEETQAIMDVNLDFLPLKSYVNIIEGNALQLDWQQVLPKEKCSYIMGNPPFVGARLMSPQQKKDLLDVYVDSKGKTYKNAGNIDYVSGWFYKASQYMQDTQIQAALVSTNSITQGEQVAPIWKPLIEGFGIHINFAWKTFKWTSESSDQAAVHVVIIGFSPLNLSGKRIFTNQNNTAYVEKINPYLTPADNIFIENQKQPISQGVPCARSGNKPIDGGFYLFTAEEKDAFLAREPRAAKFFRPWIGAHEFINRYCRYCLWLGEATPAEIRSMPAVMERVAAVRDFRLSSKSAGTVKLADNPLHFHVETIPDNTFLVLPLTSSERRRYVPIGFITPNYLASNLVLVVSNAELYHFGVLTSNVFMSWMRTVCGRLEMRYRITKDNVYNNFPWPTPTEAQRVRIEETAQGILDARAMYPDSSLADLYDEVLMPVELRRAHQANDRAVMEAYGFWGRLNTEPECVAALMSLYQQLTAQ